jgi:CarboxypepD_reg-like domain/TonB-dependent Receptor Plug Domain
MFSKSLLFTFLSFLSLQFATAQKGKIVGKVLSAKTGEALIGATISVMPDNKKTQSDLNGNYTLTVTSDKELVITCTYVSYSAKTINNIIVKNGDVLTQDIVMDKAGELSAVVIQGTSGRKKETINSILIAQKNSSNVSDGISAEVIKRTPDRNTSDILRRVSGASVQDDKFVVVRGLNDRYNAAFLNGSPLLSTEADRKAFSFDIFPANMLDNLVIYKQQRPICLLNLREVPFLLTQKMLLLKTFNRLRSVLVSIRLLPSRVWNVIMEVLSISWE